jgi:hypothetical protein
MSLIKNTAGQFLYAVLNNRNDGNPITSGATLELVKDGSAPAAAGATLTHKTNGLWEAALTQADTNANNIGYVWSGTNVISQGGTIVTVDYARNSVALILAAVNAILADTGTDGVVLAPGSTLSVADEVLKRDWTAISGEALYSLLNAVRFLRNEWNTTEVPGSVVVKKEDGTTTAWSRVVDTDPNAQPIVGVS